MALKKYKRATIALGTIVEVSLWLPEQENPSPIFIAVYQAIQSVHQTMSVHDDTSDLGRYRLASEGEIVCICAHTANVLLFSEQLWLESQGLFDVCIGHALAKQAYLLKNWSSNQQDMPRKHKLNITASEDHFSVQKIANTLIDLGGVAKGYAVDLATETLQSLHVPAALINAGGDMRIFGEVTEPIHIRQQDIYNEIYFQHLIDLHQQALASSGMPSNHEVNLKNLPIVNPQTQQCLPASHTMRTVLADTAMVADAFTKLAWLNPIDGGLSDSLFTKYNARLMNT